MYDVLCLASLIVFMFFGISKGLVRSAFGIASTVVSLYLTYKLFPSAVRLLRALGVYNYIKQALEDSMNLQGAADQVVHQMQTEFIKKLPQSPFILGHLQANNNREAYGVLNVSDLSGYIAGFFANMAVNLIASVLLFIIIRILLSMALSFIDILAKLPVINAFNRLGGAIFGLASGLLFIWAVFCAMTFVFLYESNAELYNRIESGGLTGFLYKNNPIMNFLVMLIPR